MRLFKIQLNSAQKQGSMWSSFLFQPPGRHYDVSSKEVPLLLTDLGMGFAPGVGFMLHGNVWLLCKLQARIPVSKYHRI